MPASCSLGFDNPWQAGPSLCMLSSSWVLTPLHDCHFPPCCPHPARDLTPCIKWPVHGYPFSLSGVLTSHIRQLLPVDALFSLLVLWLLTLDSSPYVDTLVTLLGFWHPMLDCPLQHGHPLHIAWTLSLHVGRLPLRVPSFTCSRPPCLLLAKCKHVPWR